MSPQECRALRDARQIAAEILFPAAQDVDAGDRVPERHLDVLAEKGMYGLAAPEDITRLDLPDFPSVLRLVEILAGGCLATTFVWVQHHGAVMAVGGTENHVLRDAYLDDLAEGRRRAGVAVGAAVKPGSPMVRAERVDGGYVFDGVAPWVTGWDMIDTLYAAGRDEDGHIVFGLLDAEVTATLSVEPLQMLAVQASRTVTVRFDRHFVPEERVSSILPQATYLDRDVESLRFTGALSVGLAERAISLLGEDAGGLPDDLAGARERLLSADGEHVPVARADCSALALRAASALVVSHGARSILTGSQAGRLVREAQFLLVFGSRPHIRSALLDQFAGPTG